MLGVASIDSLLLQARLRYLGRLLRTRPAPLWALLQTRIDGQKSAWARQCCSHLVAAWNLSPALTSRLPCPDGNDDVWLEYITSNEHGWSTAVSECCFVSSIVDRGGGGDVPSHTTVARTHRCVQCNVGFPTTKAPAQHERIKHKKTNPIQRFVCDSPVCARCGICLSHTCLTPGLAGINAVPGT